MFAFVKIDTRDKVNHEGLDFLTQHIASNRETRSLMKFAYNRA